MRDRERQTISFYGNYSEYVIFLLNIFLLFSIPRANARDAFNTYPYAYPHVSFSIKT